MRVGVSSYVGTGVSAAMKKKVIGSYNKVILLDTLVTLKVAAWLTRFNTLVTLKVAAWLTRFN